MLGSTLMDRAPATAGPSRADMGKARPQNGNSGRGYAAPSLKPVGILASLSAEARARFGQRCNWHRYQAGETIVDHLEASSDVYYIAEGEVRVSIYSVDGKAITLCDLGPGDMFGEYAAIDGAPRSASIEAQTNCQVALLPAGAFRELLLSEPALMLALMQRVVNRVRELTTRVYEFSALTVRRRTQAEVLRLIKSARRVGNTARIVPAPTHAEIASRISTHREAVTRELNRLARLGILERSGGSLIVSDVARLASMVHDCKGE